MGNQDCHVGVGNFLTNPIGVALAIGINIDGVQQLEKQALLVALAIGINIDRVAFNRVEVGPKNCKIF